MLRQPGADAHGEQIDADHGGKLRHRIAQQIAGQGAGDQLVGQPQEATMKTETSRGRCMSGASAPAGLLERDANRRPAGADFLSSGLVFDHRRRRRKGLRRQQGFELRVEFGDTLLQRAILFFEGRHLAPQALAAPLAADQCRRGDQAGNQHAEAECDQQHQRQRAAEAPGEEADRHRDVVLQGEQHRQDGDADARNQQDLHGYPFTCGKSVPRWPSAPAGRRRFR